MPHNNFDDFARGFRERTAARLLEFEKAMAKAQDDLEKSAQRAAQSQSQSPAHSRTQAPQVGPHGQSQRPNRPRGQVQSVLRRG